MLHGTPDALVGAVLLERVGLVLDDGEEVAVAQVGTVEQGLEDGLGQSEGRWPKAGGV